MKKGITLVACLLGTTLHAAAPSSLVGTYNCKGFDPVKPEVYTATLTISLLSDRIYAFEWQLQKNEHFKGKGLLQKEVLSVVYQESEQQTKDHLKHGLQIYRVQPDHRSINGEWFYLDNDKIGHEDCVRK